MQVTAADMRAAQTRVRPSAMREVALELPAVRWADVGGLADVKQRLREAVEWPQRHPDALKRLGARVRAQKHSLLSSPHAVPAMEGPQARLRITLASVAGCPRKGQQPHRRATRQGESCLMRPLLQAPHSMLLHGPPGYTPSAELQSAVHLFQ